MHSVCIRFHWHSLFSMHLKHIYNKRIAMQCLDDNEEQYLEYLHYVRRYILKCRALQY